MENFAYIIAVVGLTCAFLSFLFSFRMAHLTREGDTVLKNFLFWMSFSDILFSLHYIKFVPIVLHREHFWLRKMGEEFCSLIGWTHLSFLIATQSWYACITWELMRMLGSKQNQPKRIEKWSFLWKHGIVWSLSFGFSTYCFIRSDFVLLENYQGKVADCYLQTTDFRLVDIILYNS